MSKPDELKIIGKFAESLLRLDFEGELPTFKVNDENRNVFNYIGLLLESIRDKYKESVISKKALDTFLTVMDDTVLIVTDTAFTIRGMNQHGEVFFGGEAGSFIGTSIFELMPGIRDHYSDPSADCFLKSFKINSGAEGEYDSHGELWIKRTDTEDNEVNELVFVFKPTLKRAKKKSVGQAQISCMENVIEQLTTKKEKSGLNSEEVELLASLDKLRSTVTD